MAECISREKFLMFEYRGRRETILLRCTPTNIAPDWITTISYAGARKKKVEKTKIKKRLYLLFK
jgi:hypothetical protein